MVVFESPEDYLNPDEILRACQGELHPMAEKGIRLFNAGEFWHAHEALEEAWLEEPGPARNLYKGILQTGVAYLHLQRRNFIGAIKMYLRAKKWLAPWPDHCRTVDVGQLKIDLEAAVKAAGHLGPDRLDKFDQCLFKKIERVAL
jgi:predicted metal-dependent hydrolase